MYINKIIGKGVLDRNANIVGKVTDIDISVPPWTINHFVVKSGIIKKFTIEVQKIDKIGDKVFLNVTKEELGK